jgi:hypothetical protein
MPLNGEDVAQIRQLVVDQVSHYIQVLECPDCKKNTFMVRILPVPALRVDAKVEQVQKFRCMECQGAFTLQTNLKKVLEK